jgi:hypothetical protein
MKTWGSGGIALPFLVLAIDRVEWFSFMLHLLYPLEKSPGTHWRGGWVDFRVDLDVTGKREKSCPCRPALSLITIPTELSRLLVLIIFNYYRRYKSNSSFLKYVLCRTYELYRRRCMKHLTSIREVPGSNLGRTLNILTEVFRSLRHSL